MGPDMPVYASLNDVATCGPGLADFDPGSTQIWYAHMNAMVTSQPLCLAVYAGWRPRLASVIDPTIDGNYEILGMIDRLKEADNES